MPVLSALLLVLPSLVLLAQSSSRATPNKASSATEASHRQSAQVYEDDEIKIEIPKQWRPAMLPHPAIEPYKINGKIVVESSAIQAQGKILLQKDEYTLSLAYNTSHAGPGRFIEALNIPWLNVMQAWTCSLYFQRIPQPANSKLLFMNLILRPGGSQVNKACGIKKGFGESVTAGKHEYFGGDRWYAGYFSANEDYFFGSEGEDCGEKSYSLTTDAKIPEQLPPPDDPQLHQTILEAIDIVNSIHYKRCAPLSPQ